MISAIVWMVYEFFNLFGKKKERNREWQLEL
jgi:hypothetical protein